MWRLVLEGKATYEGIERSMTLIDCLDLNELLDAAEDARVEGEANERARAARKPRR